MAKILSAGTKVELSVAPIAVDLKTDLGLAKLPAAWTDLSCTLTGISTETTEREQIETTSLCEVYSKTYIGGLKDQDTASSDAFFDLKSVEGKALAAVAKSGAKHMLRVTFVDGTAWVSATTVEPYGFNASVGDTVKTTINFKLVGEPTIVPAV